MTDPTTTLAYVFTHDDPTNPETRAAARCEGAGGDSLMTDPTAKSQWAYLSEDQRSEIRWAVASIRSALFANAPHNTDEERLDDIATIVDSLRMHKEGFKSFGIAFED